jgi:hypothetical protein
VYGYFARLGRCEGRFRKRNYGDSFIIAGYVSGARNVSVSSAPRIRLSWAEAGADTVKIRAISISPSVAYQMDTRVGVPIREFVWPTEILRALRLNIGVLGIRASVAQGPAGRRESVLIPVRVDGPAADPTLRLVIYSRFALKEVYLSIRDPRTGQLVLRPTLAKTTASALQPFEVALPAQVPSGRYHVEVGATLATEGHPVTADAVVLIPARGNAP